MDQPKLTLPQALHLVSMRVTSIEKILAKEGLLKMARDGQYEHANDHEDEMGGQKEGRKLGLGRSAVQSEDLQMMMTRLHAVESSVSDLTKDVATVKASAAAPAAVSAASAGTGGGLAARASVSPAMVQQMEAFKQGFQKQSAVIKQLSDRLKETQARVTELETQMVNNQKDIDTLNETLMSVMAQQTAFENNQHGMGMEMEDIGMDEFGMDPNMGVGSGAGSGTFDMNGDGIGMDPYVPFGHSSNQAGAGAGAGTGERSDTSGSATGFETSELDDFNIQLPLPSF